MNTGKFFVKVALSILPLYASTQGDGNKNEVRTPDTATVNQLLQQSKEYLNKNPDSTIILAEKAVNMSGEISFDKGKAAALKNIGLGYYYKGKYLETLDYWTQSLKMYETLKDETGVANLLNNIAAVYNDQGDDSKALEYALRSLSISEKLNDKFRILSALNTVANIYYNKKSTWDKALDYLLRALPLAAETANTEAQGVILENIGEIYFYMEDDTKAMKYYQDAINVLGNSINSSFAYNGIAKVQLKYGRYDEALRNNQMALNIAEKLDGKLNIVRSLQGIASVFRAKGDYGAAFEYFNKAEKLALEMRSTPNLKDLYLEMAGAYEKAGNFKQAYAYQKKLDAVKDTLFNEITEKKLGTLQLEFDMEKKQSQINLLTKDNDLKALNIRKQRLAKNAFLVGLVLIGLIALLILRNYRAKVKTHKIVNRQKKEIEGLLLNILPQEVANELQEKGYSTPRHYENVSVMFTDFKGFTIIADNMSPQELVEELSACFVAFDAIMEKYNLEKIKTIGDSYMCAGGIPTPDSNHVYNIVKASLEIQTFIKEYNRRRVERGLASWEARIGIHVGPLVAGVVGKKKYAYDIWGSTVNIASRMESNGMPGKVNISSATYHLIRDRFECSYRGKHEAKNLGQIDMYFVDREKEEGEVVEPVILEEKELKVE
jgi:adenylate cyclase